MISTKTLSVLAALALVGCGSSDEEAKGLGPPPRFPVPGCESIDPSPCDVRTSACEARLLTLAACMRGSEPGDPPPLSLMSTDEYDAYLRDWYAMHPFDAASAHFEVALTVLGLAAPGALEPDAVVSEHVDFVWGFYREDLKDIVLVDQPDADPVQSSAVLLHELVHALQDREVDLTAFHAATGDAFDGYLAADAVVEGEARFHQTHFGASLLGLDARTVDWKRVFQSGVEFDEKQILEDDSPYTAAFHAFPYEWGARYVSLGWEKTGRTGVLDLFASPPTATHSLMASVDELVPATFAPVGMSEPTPPPEWTAVVKEQLGAFGTFLMLGKRTDAEEARALALSWRGDMLEVFARTDAPAGEVGPTATVWACEFADAATVARVASFMRQGFPADQVQIAGTRLTLVTADDGSSLSWALSPSTP